MINVIQLKNKDGKVYTPSIIKQVHTITLKAGQSFTDADIEKAKQVVIHYSINGNRYLKSMIIPRPWSDWYWDGFEAGNIFIYFKIDWENKQIKVSPYSTIDDAVCILAYDLII